MAEPVSILLVDDDPRNLDSLESILECPEYRLVRATDADGALRALVVDDIAVMVLDIRMPGTDGLELAHLIKQRRKTANIPIIFLTAYYNEEDQVIQGYSAGAVDYLSKPCKPAILRSKVAAFVDLHRKSRALEAEITERREAEARILELNVQLERRIEELGHANAALEHARARTLELSRRLVEVQEEERRHVALELHDEAGQSLTAIKLRCALIERAHGRDEALLEQMHELRAAVDEVMDRLHGLSVHLRPAALDRLGLCRALAQLAETARSRGFHVTCEVDPLEGVRLSPTVEISLYRIAQEALTNCQRHSGANHAAITMRCAGQVVQLEVRDDGVGFDVDAAVASGRLGLGGMTERAELLGGGLEITSRPGGGSVIRATLPIETAPVEASEVRPASHPGGATIES